MARDRAASRRRYCAELKARVTAKCDAPGASVAKVAMSHALNANIVHRWRKLARGRDGAGVLAPSRVALPPNSGASMPQFVPMSLSLTPSSSAPVDIQIELHRGATLMKLTWPIAAAADCAAWMRELLR